MKIRDKLIKLLGGYTSDEYNIHVKVPLKVHVEQRKVDTLKMCHQSLQPIDPEYRRWYIMDILAKMNEKLLDEGYVRVIEEKENDSPYYVIKCLLDVVRQGEPPC